MGKGLQPSPTGTHIAFCAGTGALCFTDLMAHIAQAVMGMTPGGQFEGGGIDIELFEFHLYVSFPSAADGVAFDLMTALHEFCERNNLKTFKLIARLSKEKVNPARWDENWITKTVGGYSPDQVKRVWVCGPPVLNETFDRTLGKMRQAAAETKTKVIPWHKIELL